MSTCHTYPKKTDAIKGFCDEFPDFCPVAGSVPSNVEQSILLDNDANNDKNDCDGGFDVDLACPTTCGKSQTTVSATYSVVADAFGGGEECPYHDGFFMEMTCPATPACEVPCQGTWSGLTGNYTCPTTCGYSGGTLTQSKTWTAGTAPTGQTFVNCPTTETQQKTCPATPACEVPCQGSWSGWSGNYTCPTACYVAVGGLTLSSDRPWEPSTLTRSKTWITSPAPPGQTFVNCPTIETQQKTCPPRNVCPPCEYTAWTNVDGCTKTNKQRQVRYRRASVGSTEGCTPETPDTERYITGSCGLPTPPTYRPQGCVII